MKASPGTRRLFFNSIVASGFGLTAWCGSVPGQPRWVWISDAQSGGGSALDATQVKEMRATRQAEYIHMQMGAKAL